ncbi:lipid A export permease/ATP-binding protein MsbA [Undibacterium fentianense]|uniref:Lipid A export permease/ATP-binding protein MsbA n=1 Tax=Undibacterium fentianense TaxID=2828728 RepID=A0A941E6C9_9BURK|nr:lipid A export permease/ATP-binding protein MsbA [Undibacterium fentianense]MBR7799553.1 lipid A export permease/ATP-binding protein MsbA [Undibacterium fentianense]
MAKLNKSILKRLWASITQYRAYLTLTVLTMCGTALTEVALPWGLGKLLDHGFGKSSANGPATEVIDFPLWYVPAALIGIFVVRGVCTFTTSYLMGRISVNLLNELRAKVFDKLLHVPVGFYHTESSGRIINTIMFEAQQIVEMVKVSITTLFRDSLTVAVLMGYLIWLNWKLTLVTIILIPGMTLLVRGVSKRLRRLNHQSLEVSGELTQVIEETTRAHQVIRIFGGQRYEQERFEAKNKKLGSYSMKSTVAVSFTTPLTQILASVAVAIVIMLALAQARQDATTVGDFVTFITAMMMLLTPLKRLADLNGPLQRGMAAAESVYSMVDTIPETEAGQKIEGRAKGQLEFKNLIFRYPGQDQAALQNINLQVQAGETIALVGMSGGGKTSLVNLVPRFYEADSGALLLDGVAIEEISLKSLREQIAMVSQNVVLFDDTLAANIAYGDNAPNAERIANAISAAHLQDVVNEMPEGLHTMIGDNGMRLSGGQRQRLAIARAIYKDAPILILDEATSALDSESERAVQAALDELMQGRTTLVIAHRLSTIERADRIVVLVDGKIVEVGSHAELLAKDAAYANLYRLQFTT